MQLTQPGTTWYGVGGALPNLGAMGTGGLGQTGQSQNPVMYSPPAAPTVTRLPRGKWIDPATGQLWRWPQTDAERAEAQKEAETLALGAYGPDEGAFQRLLSEVTKETPTEPIINRGTDEIAESERAARQDLAEQAAAAGAGLGSGTTQAAFRTLGSQYAGMRANLARDVRQGAAEGAASRKLSALSILAQRQRPPIQRNATPTSFRPQQQAQGQDQGDWRNYWLGVVGRAKGPERPRRGATTTPQL